jgi:ABC-2 type transport system permease protein
MVRRIARKELLELLRDGRFRWTASAVMTLLAASLLTGWRHYVDVNRQIEAAAAEQRELWLHTPDRNPHAAAHHGMYVFKPLMPLSAMDNGVDAFAGRSFFLEAHDLNLAQSKPVEDTTSLQRFGEATAAATMQLLVPLLIVLLVYPVFAGEREQGTLRFLLGVGLRHRDLALGKALGTAGVLLLLLVPAAGLGVAATALHVTPHQVAISAPRMLAAMGAYLTYFAIFAALSLAVSAIVSTARLALVVLISFWFLTCLVAPRVMADVARHAAAVPSTIEFQQRIDEDKSRIPADWQARVTADLMRQYGVQREEDLPVDPLGAHLIEGDKIESAIYENRFGELFAAHDREDLIYRMGGVFAPMLAMQPLSMGLAGTDYNQHRHFAAAVGKYRREWLDILHADILRNRRPGELTYSRGQDLWAQVPAMRYQPPGLAWVIQRYASSVGLLAGWLVVSLAVAVVALRRIRIE